MNPTLEPLTADEQDALAVCERRIANGIEAFRDVVFALKEVRDGRLYRHAHATFEDYCQSRWGFTRRRGYQLIEAAEAIASLPTDCEALLHSQRAAEEVAKVPEPIREKAVRLAAESGKVTAKSIKDAAAEIQCEPKESATASTDAETLDYQVSLGAQEVIALARHKLSRPGIGARQILNMALALKREAARLEKLAGEQEFQG